MRHDARNTGRTSIPGVYRGDKPWAFKTGKGIFSTPVIGADGTVYVGSADSDFYAIRGSGKLRWKFKTGNIIDSAAVLRGNTVTFGSGDEVLYRLTTKRKVVWRFRPTKPPVQGQQVNWWEGNADVGPGGVVYAGNTGGYEYAINPNGKQKWVFAAGNSVWTDPAFAADGTAYVGSLDRSVYALDANGNKLWSTPTIGFIVSSPALGTDGTVYVGSFDSNLYALDGKTGVPKWQFSTGDHIYSSPAVGKDGTIYFASTDGNVYALDPAGNLKWRYDTGDVVRSSPVLGPNADGSGDVLYVGAGNGTLFALDAASGKRRWSYDTTSADPILRDRNDLNASPALGKRGVYIGGEDGSVHYVPYDYCLHRKDARCDTNPGQVFADDLSRVFPVTSGGNLQQGGYPQALPDSTTLVSRLVVRNQGTTADAQMQPLPDAKSLVTPDPPFPFSATLSGDGHYLFVVPDTFLSPATDYTLHVSGAYSAGGLRVGPQAIGATSAAPFSDAIKFRTAPGGGKLPLSKPTRKRASAFQLSRLAVPLPPFLPSVNQIGFDSYDLIAGRARQVAAGAGRRREVPPVAAGRPPRLPRAARARPEGVARVPHRRRLPRQRVHPLGEEPGADVQLRRRPSPALRPTRPDGGEPAREARRGAVRGGAVRDRPDLRARARGRHPPLQSRRRARVEWHVRHEAVRGARGRQRPAPRPERVEARPRAPDGELRRLRHGHAEARSWCALSGPLTRSAHPPDGRLDGRRGSHHVPQEHDRYEGLARQRGDREAVDPRGHQRSRVCARLRRRGRISAARETSLTSMFRSGPSENG